MKFKSKLFSVLTAAVFSVTGLGFVSSVGFSDKFVQPVTVEAASTDYPAQLMRIALNDNSKNLNISGYDDNAAVIASDDNGSQNENWRFDYVGNNSKGSYFRIVNMGSGRLLTPQNYGVSEGSSVVTYGTENNAAQCWYITPVGQDKNGDDLYYKIVNYNNTDLALTNNSGKFKLSKYSGANTQKFLLKTAGLQGFAGCCKDMSGNMKASAVGGVLGDTVQVSTFDELKKACTSSGPKTIIITKNISGKSGKSNYTIQTSSDGSKRYQCKDNYIYLEPDKTIIGSYSANTLYNVYFRTYDEKYGPGHNIVIRNIDITHDTELNTDNIWEFSYGWNVWIDHCTFEGHKNIETSSLKSDDWDKFLNLKGTADFFTFSDCTFGHHEYGVLMGYPSDDENSYKTYNGHPLVTIATNYYQDTVTRAPGLVRYGYYHSMNNYVDNFSMGYTVHTACKLFTEACYFSNGGNVFCDWNKDAHPGSFADSNSKYVSCQRTKRGEGTSTHPSYAGDCTWRPKSNYTYKVLTADNAKNWCTKYSGSKKSADSYGYVAFDKVGMPSASYISKPSQTVVTTTTTKPVTTTTTTTTITTNTAPVQNSVTVEGAENGNILDAGWLSGGVLVSALKVNDTYSIMASAEKNVNVYKQNNVTADGKHNISSTISLGGAGNQEQRSVQINAKEAGNLIVYMASSAADTPRSVKLIDKSGNIIQTIENVVGGTANSYTYTVPKAGTYYLTSVSSGLHLYYMEMQYGNVQSKIDGDVNGDGQLDNADVTALQKWLIGFPKASLANYEAADLHKDGIINVFDLALMKRLILKNSKPSVPEEPVTQTNPYEPENFTFSGKVYFVGDSTVCDYSDEKVKAQNLNGWGMKFADKFDGVTATNLAIAGRSSRSFLQEKNYQTLCSSLGKGDYLYIQFGHNDEKTDETKFPGLGTYPSLDMASLDSNGMDSSGRYSYEWIILNKYIKLAQSKGAVPVVITPITRRNTNGTPNYASHTPYQQALIKLCEDNSVALIDMTALTTKLYNDLYNYGGADETAKMHCWTDNTHTELDNTHLSVTGANKIASMIAEQSQKLGLTIGSRKK